MIGKHEVAAFARSTTTVCGAVFACFIPVVGITVVVWLLTGFVLVPGTALFVFFILLMSIMLSAIVTSIVLDS